MRNQRQVAPSGGIRILMSSLFMLMPDWVRGLTGCGHLEELWRLAADVKDETWEMLSSCSSSRSPSSKEAKLCVLFRNWNCRRKGKDHQYFIVFWIAPPRGVSVTSGNRWLWETTNISTGFPCPVPGPPHDFLLNSVEVWFNLDIPGEAMARGLKGSMSSVQF